MISNLITSKVDIVAADKLLGVTLVRRIMDATPGRPSSIKVESIEKDDNGKTVVYYYPVY